jgi:hypothetical protein
MSKFDEEKHLGEIYSHDSQSPPHDDGVDIIASRPKLFQQLNQFLSRLGGEERGIERVLPHERSDQVAILLLSF